MRIIISISLLISILSCKSGKPVNESKFDPIYNSGPPTLLYKTKKDYFDKVPVLLSEDKTRIVSYPHPSDIVVENKLSLPSQLNQGYLLDNRGIGTTVAFLNLTYEEYSKLETLPSLDKLYQLIEDKDPLLEICNCGNRENYINPIVELNKAIEENLIRKKCKILK